jgi:hypothetical protein
MSPILLFGARFLGVEFFVSVSSLEMGKSYAVFTTPLTCHLFSIASAPRPLRRTKTCGKTFSMVCRRQYDRCSRYPPADGQFNNVPETTIGRASWYEILAIPDEQRG